MTSINWIILISVLNKHSEEGQAGMQRKWMKSAAVWCYRLRSVQACLSRDLWSATSPSVIMNLQWNHWAALASVMLGEMTVRGTGRVESSMKSNSNPGTMSRPKCAYILSQLSPPAHPSSPQRTVTPFSSPGIANIPFLLLLPSPRLYCQPLLPPDFSSVSPSPHWACLVFFSREQSFVDKEDTNQKGGGDIFIQKRNTPRDMFVTLTCQNCPCVTMKSLTPLCSHQLPLTSKLKLSKKPLIILNTSSSSEWIRCSAK